MGGHPVKDCPSRDYSTEGCTHEMVIRGSYSVDSAGAELDDVQVDYPTRLDHFRGAGMRLIISISCS